MSEDYWLDQRLSDAYFGEGAEDAKNGIPARSENPDYMFGYKYGNK